MSLAALNQTIDPKHLPHANPDDTADFLAGCTECSNALRDWQTIDAIELLNWQLTNNGSTAATWFLWAVHRVMTGTLEGVERLLELCLEQTPNCLEALAFRQALALRNGQTAIATTCGLKLGSGIEANPAAQQAAQLYAQAQTMLPYPAQHEAAARLLTQALELAPWDARAWYGLALTEHGKDARRCAALATEAVIRNPLVPEAWALAITGLALSDQISAAGRAVGCGISLFPDNPTLIGSLAHLNAVGGVFDPGINRAWYTLPEGRLPATYLKSLVRRRNKGATTIRKELVLPAYGSINSHELATKAFSKAIAFNLYPKNAEHYTEELAALRQATQNFAAGRHKFTDPTPIVGTAFQWQVLDENACEPLSQLADAVRASCPMLEHTAEAPAKGVVRPRRIAVLKGLAGDDRNRAVDGLLSSLPADQYVLRSFLPIFAAPQRQSAAANDMV
ncbi:MAG: hypothetical protein EBU92_05505, partial [Betaproteobacteria bacterium]|nr:hypothetical protein [Betaproteobacteria bacterium]